MFTILYIAEKTTDLDENYMIIVLLKWYILQCSRCTDILILPHFTELMCGKNLKLTASQITLMYVLALICEWNSVQPRQPHRHNGSLATHWHSMSIKQCLALMTKQRHSWKCTTTRNSADSNTTFETKTSLWQQKVHHSTTYQNSPTTQLDHWNMANEPRRHSAPLSQHYTDVHKHNIHKQVQRKTDGMP